MGFPFSGFLITQVKRKLHIESDTANFYFWHKSFVGFFFNSLEDELYSTCNVFRPMQATGDVAIVSMVGEWRRGVRVITRHSRRLYKVRNDTQSL